MKYRKNLFMIVFMLIAMVLTGFSFTTKANSEIASSLNEESYNHEAVLGVNIDKLLELEDNSVPDPVVKDSPEVLKTANTVDALQSAAATTTKPNIVIIMLDDVNPHDGRLWTKERTPTIYNNLISKGINFTNFYGETPLCCPGRAGYLTGQHTLNHNVKTLDGTIFNPTETIATELKVKNYFTILTGKYLNAFEQIPVSRAIPPGWSRFDALYEPNSKYYDYKILSTGKVIKSYGHSAVDYSTDVFTNIAIKRLKEAPADRPIFAYIAPASIHGPNTPAPRYIGSAKCATIEKWSPLNSYELDVTDKPQFIQEKKRTTPGFSIKTHCETMMAVDDMVRRIRFELAKQGRLDNTIFILTADNGMSWGEHRWEPKIVPWSTHVPLFVSWPAGRGVSSRVEKAVLSNIDIAPTLCELAGCTMGPYPNGQQTADGISFLSLLKDQVLDTTRDAIFETEPPGFSTPGVPPWYGVRTTEKSSLGRWHYVEYNSGEKELYQLSDKQCFEWSVGQEGDPCELNNLLKPGAVLTAGTQEVYVSLKDRLVELKKEKGYTPPPLLE